MRLRLLARLAGLALVLSAQACGLFVSIPDVPPADSGAGQTDVAHRDAMQAREGSPAREAGRSHDGGKTDGGPTDSGRDATPHAPFCSAGARECVGNAPLECIADAWLPVDACGGSTPTCSNGVCSTYFATGSIYSTAPRADAGVVDASYRLLSGGFEWRPRACSADGGYCVRGGIVP